MKNFRFLFFFVFLAFTIGEGKTFTLEPPLKSKQEKGRERLLSLFAGEWVSRSLYVVTKLEIADHLELEPKSIEELAQLTSSHADSLYRLLHMLEGFGIFEVKKK